MSEIFLYLEDNLQLYNATEIERIIATFPRQRREVAMSYKFEQGRKESALAYRLLCQGLQERFQRNEQPTFVIGEHGKPSLLEYPDIHFNLSHCKQAVLCALSRKPVGVDVERIGRYHEDVARYCMNDEEMQQITQASDPEIPFTRLWTQKEAVVKLRGTGLTDSVKEILTHCEGIHLDTVEQIEKGYIYTVAHWD